MASPLNYSSFAKPIIVKPLTDIVNLSISTSTFPDRLKEAQVGFQSSITRKRVDWHPKSE
jgi:hypothetical protein